MKEKDKSYRMVKMPKDDKTSAKDSFMENAWKYSKIPLNKNISSEKSLGIVKKRPTKKLFYTLALLISFAVILYELSWVGRSSIALFLIATNVSIILMILANFLKD